MKGESPGQNSNQFAVFIDIENFFISCKELKLPFDIAPIFKKLKEDGNLSFRKSYGDLEKICQDSELRKRIRQMLQRHLVQHQDIVYQTSFKNSSDIALAVEALSVAHLYSDVSSFCIVASDRDFVPLMRRLQELGKTVYGVGVSATNTPDIYQEVCNKLIYYETLIETAPDTAITISPRVASAKLFDFFEVLERALGVLNEKGELTCGARLAPFMRQLKPDFDPMLVGAKTFKQFIEMAEEHDTVVVDWQGHRGDYVVRLPGDQEKPAGAQLPIIRVKKRDPKEQASYYRRLLENKLKTKLPSLEERRDIIAALAEIYRRLPSSSHGIWLKNWSFEAYEHLRPTSPNLDQRTIFKLLYSLYLARCFHASHVDDIYDPFVTIQAGSDEWEQRMHSTFLRAIIIEDPRVDLDEEALSLLLYEDTDHKDDIGKLIDGITVH